MRRAGILAFLAVAWLGGCGTFSDDEAEVPVEVPADQPSQDAPSSREVHVETVHLVEIGRTRDGFTVTAFGTAPAPGYGKPRLRARRDGGISADGFLDFDFVAIPTELGLERGQGATVAPRIRADLILDAVSLLGPNGIRATGIRIHAASGGVHFLF